MISDETNRGEAFGKYRLTEQVGEGGMGVVYRAEVDDSDGIVRKCAIKRIRPAFAGAQAFVDALVAEGRLYAHLHHPGIVQLLEVGSIDGERYLAMQWLDGIDLRRLLKQCARKGVRLLPSLACFIAYEVASALAYAHSLCGEDGSSLEIIHRDVNPANILVTRSGRMVLIDFGIAHASSQLERRQTEAGMIKGTVGYMSPEQSLAERVDARSDVFSLGAVLYECLTGTPPFRGRNPLETLRLVSEAKVAPPSSLRPELGPEIDQVVLKALARDKNERYASADELVAALRPIVFRHQADAMQLSALVANLQASDSAACTADSRTEDLPMSCSTTIESRPQVAAPPFAGARRTLRFLQRGPQRKWYRLAVGAAVVMAVCAGLAAWARDQGAAGTLASARPQQQAMAVELRTKERPRPLVPKM
jgi:serine/threonine-protein kinase